MRCIAVAIALIVFAIMLSTEWLMYDFGIAPRSIMLGSAAVAAILAMIFCLKLMAHASARRDSMHRQLEVVKETNHHIRNALELIEFSAHSTKDQRLIEQISSGVDRIQWVLREVLGERGWETPPAGTKFIERRERPLEDDDY